LLPPAWWEFFLKPTGSENLNFETRFLAIYMENADNKKFLDIELALKTKNPGLYRFLPRFLINAIKKLVRQDDMNRFVADHGHMGSLDFVSGILVEFGVHVEVKGLENVPETGGCIMAANHPLGGLDAMALVAMTAKKRKDIKFIVNDILLQLKNLREIFVGVNKHGRNSTEVLQSMDSVYTSGNVVMIFPAGLVSRKKNGVVKDLEWKKSFITKARRHQLNILPVFIEGRNTERFYNAAVWRERLGIKANVEMILLPGEMYHQKGKTITIIFGKPLPHHLFDRSRSDAEWAQHVKELVYALGKEHH
jgi:putative hemolysin